jgi:hypothetical protein
MYIASILYHQLPRGPLELLLHQIELQSVMSSASLHVCTMYDQLPDIKVYDIDLYLIGI